ncbi:SanA/YdcF family protein [Geomonas oryzisoli]|uniref:SanA/YdcF family protein n=1 Tax=Geomonas oryzisoli TaxID=2847992 RepID=UPI001EF0E465|nr:ElyC/SanA/YdcF family protein [Geomonas oryzisoli]
MVVAALVSLAVMAGAAAIIGLATAGLTYDSIEKIPHRRVGLLLGCSRMLSGGRANLFFAHRVEAAAELFRARKVDYLLVSGDNRRKEYNEAGDMREALIKAGVPAERIYCDYAGLRTLDSVIRAREVFCQDEITVISQRFHNERAIFIGMHNGIDAIGYNAADVDAYNSFRTRCREQLARVRTVLDVCLLSTAPRFGGEKIEIGVQAPVLSNSY